MHQIRASQFIFGSRFNSPCALFSEASFFYSPRVAPSSPALICATTELMRAWLAGRCTLNGSDRDAVASAGRDTHST